MPGEVTLYGSLVRGDLDPRISDVDFFVVVSGDCPVPLESLIESLRGLFEGVVLECLGAAPARGVDIAWCLEGELRSGCD